MKIDFNFTFNHTNKISKILLVNVAKILLKLTLSVLLEALCLLHHLQMTTTKIN